MMGKGCCGTMGQGMMAHGCPMMGEDVEKKVENTADGVTIKISSKNPETVKKIREHVAKMGECCAKMAEGCTMMKKVQQEAPKAEKK
jgi:TusA-related sulfurtransferase